MKKSGTKYNQTKNAGLCGQMAPNKSDLSQSLRCPDLKCITQTFELNTETPNKEAQKMCFEANKFGSN